MIYTYQNGTLYSNVLAYQYLYLFLSRDSNSQDELREATVLSCIKSCTADRTLVYMMVLQLKKRKQAVSLAMKSFLYNSNIPKHKHGLFVCVMYTDV